MLKKSLATIVALTLIFALAPALPVWAAGTGAVTGAISGVAPFSPATTPIAVPSITQNAADRTIKLKINFAAIQEDNAAAFDAEIPDNKTNSDFSAITVSITNRADGTASTLFTPTFVAAGAAGTAAGYNLVLTPAAAVDAFNHPFDLNINFSGGGATTGTVNITGNIEPVSTAIQFINSGYDSTSGNSINGSLSLVVGGAGQNITINNAASLFKRYDAATESFYNAITNTNYVKYSISLPAIFSLVPNADGFTISALPGVATGTYSPTIRIEPATADGTTIGGITYSFANSINVRDNGPDTISSFADGDKLVRVNDSYGSTVPKGQSIYYTIPDNNYVWTTGNGTKNYSNLTTARFTGIPTGFTASIDTTTTPPRLKLTAASAVTNTANNLRLTSQSSTKAVGGVLTVTDSSTTPISGDTITGINGGFTSSSNYYITTTGNKTLNVDISDILEDDEIYPGDEVYIHLRPSFFTWQSGGTPTGVVTRALLNSGNITFKTGSLSTYIESASLKTISNNEQVISVKFKAPLVSTKAVSIKDSPIYVMHNKSTSSPSTDACRLYIGGYIMNREQDVSNDSYASFDDAPVIVADGALSNIELDLGNGVLLTARRINSGAKVYGYTTAGPQDSEDDSFFSKYNLDDMVELFTIGLNSASNTVQLDMNENYYVYAKSSDSTLAYLGRSNSNKKFPYYQKYYFSLKELSVPAAGGSGTENIDETTSGASSGAGGGDGGGTQTNNGNYNPNTGR